jgi:hypothetical protein
MSKGGVFGLVISATAFLLMSAMLVSSGGTSAAGIEGTYTSTVPGEGYFDSTWPADYTYDAKLTLQSGGGGSLWLKCTDVVVNQAGWEAAYDMLGKSQTVSVSWVSMGTSVTITIHDNYGGNYPLTVTQSGNRLSGSGTYTDISYVSNSWDMDVTKGGGSGSSSLSFGFSGLVGLAGIAAAGGFVVGFIVSILPPPHNMGGSILPRNTSPLGTPYAPSQSIGSFGAQRPGSVTSPLPDVPKMGMFQPMQFPNVEMGRSTDIRPTEIRQTDTLSKRSCPNCGATLMYTAAGWSCPGCSRPPPRGVE